MMYEKLVAEATTLQGFIEEPWVEDASVIVERGNAIAVWLARSSVMLAEAKRIYNTARTSEIGELIKTVFAENKLSANVQNQMMSAVCEKEQYLVDWITEQNKTLKHQLDWCRTSISKYKSELSIANMGREFS